MNATALDQGRLDVVAKTRSNIFNWRGHSIPHYESVDLHITKPHTRPGVAVTGAVFRFGLLLEAADVHEIIIPFPGALQYFNTCQPEYV